tara:strand:- start:7506 stop:8144 length:639 start_codon:yes stop_codon:yes gene_type:complete
MKTINGQNGAQLQNNECSSYSILLVETPDFIDSCLKQKLINSGHYIKHYTTDFKDLVEQVILHEVQILIMNVNQLGQQELGEIAKVNQLSPLPVLIFSKQVPPSVLQNNIKATIVKQAVEGGDLDYLTNTMLLACENFKKSQLSRIEFEETKTQLVARKLINSAKKLIMQQKNISEQSADVMLQKMSVDNRQTLVQVAQNVISVCRLLKPKT